METINNQCVQGDGSIEGTRFVFRNIKQGQIFWQNLEVRGPFQ